MSHEEIEVKFILDDLATTRQHIVAMGAHLRTPRTYEDNVLFDTLDHRLQQQDRLLRLRHDHRCLLTYKEPLASPDRDYKVRHEYEVQVSDLAQMRIILERLGLVPTRRYEKYRETFCYQSADILLDETPVGAFLEIEASRPAIRDLAARLHLDFDTRLTASYSDILEAVCRTYQLSFSDMTFDNFQALPIDLHACNLT